jgi:hypothetical protein
MTVIDFNTLPNDPIELYAELQEIAPTVLPENDLATLAPTTGREDGCAVWLVLLPFEKRAFKLLLNRENLQNVIAKASVCCAARS